MCLGQNLALTEIAYVVARVCQTFERLEERSGKARGSHGVCEDIILSPLEGVKVGLIRAPGAVNYAQTNTTGATAI
jgi:hypothetical protein